MEKVLKIDRPGGRRVLKFDSRAAAEGCGIACGDEYVCCLAAAKTVQPGLRPVENAPLSPPAAVFLLKGSMSLDSQSPKGSLRIQFLCHPGGGSFSDSFP